MTPNLIDIDAATLAIERVRGLLTLAEDWIFNLSDLAPKDSIPLSAALFCIREHVGQIDDLLNAGIAPKQDGEETQS